MERRNLTRASAVRLESREDGSKRITGIASVTYDGTPDTEYELWPGLRERISPGAFDRALKENHDVRALFNHDSNLVLGRTKSGTLKLSVTREGLAYEVTPADTTAYRDTVAHLERGDVDGSSFAFMVTREEWLYDQKRGVDIRDIKDVQLFDVGPVTYPAYEATTSAVRGSMLLRDQPQDIQDLHHKWCSVRHAREAEKADLVKRKLQADKLSLPL